MLYSYLIGMPEISMDLTLARHNMVKQVRTWDVNDPLVLEWMSKIPREVFALPAFQNLAFSDVEIPIGHHQVMLPPKIVGRAVAALQLQPSDLVLEIGTGTGYITVLLAHLVKQVLSLEIVPELLGKAETHIQHFKLPNIKLILGDGSLGQKEAGPFDAILLTGSLPYLPQILKEQLAPGGRLFGVYGNDPLMSAKLLTRLNKTQFSEQVLFETRIPALRHHLPMNEFKF